MKQETATKTLHKDFYTGREEHALDAMGKAQRIAFAPVVFQVARVLRNSGILQSVEDGGPAGKSLDEVVATVQLPYYGVRVLLEAGLSAELVYCDEGNYSISKTGHFILHDELTRINMDFIHDVCYKGLFSLDKSIATGKPEGLKEFGEWKTIYEALSQLPPQVQKSWFAFDHFYSDNAFPKALELVFARHPKKILDIGGNTGKWSVACAAYDPDVQVTIMDLPGQLGMAEKMIAEKGLQKRVYFHAADILDEAPKFPAGFDAVWMSQFLDCFSEEQIVSILRRCAAALAPQGSVYVLEPFWDRQRFETASFCLQQTSIYFAAMANGNSQMYRSQTFIDCVEKAGFRVEEQSDDIGLSHTLLRIQQK